jgi:4-diphosphocytidyl-2C-methyl-D-erythritol kinase
LGLGRGEQLESLPLPTNCWIVVVTPDITIPNKTSALFRDLQESDFLDGEHVLLHAQVLKATETIDPSLLVNSFTRPLYMRLPSLEAVAVAMKAAGASCIAVSGAGPTHYSVESEFERAVNVADRLRDLLRTKVQIEVVKPLPPRYLPGSATGTTQRENGPR